MLASLVTLCSTVFCTVQHGGDPALVQERGWRPKKKNWTVKALKSAGGNSTSKLEASGPATVAWSTQAGNTANATVPTATVQGPSLGKTVPATVAHASLENATEVELASPASPVVDPHVAPTAMDASWQYNLSLESIRGALVRQEDSIIFSLIERSQFHRNKPAYTTDPSQGGIVVPGFNGPLMDFVMRETETLHGKVRRYTSPTERPFFPDAVPPIILPPLAYPKVLHKASQSININPVVWQMYFCELLPAIAAPGDDFNYGSAVTADVICLQALSTRVHYGVFVAEAKYTESPELFNPLIQAQDAAGILRLLTKADVEAAVLKRVEAKAAVFGQEIPLPQSEPHSAPPGTSSVAEGGVEPRAGGSSGGHVEGTGSSQVSAGGQQRFKVEPKVVAHLYGRWIMPLTKQVQVDYLLRRLDPQ